MGLVEIADFDRWLINAPNLLQKVETYEKECQEIIALTGMLMVEQKLHIRESEGLLERIKILCTPSLTNIMEMWMSAPSLTNIMDTAYHLAPTLKSMLKILHAFYGFFRVTRQQYAFILQHADTHLLASIYWNLVKHTFSSSKTQRKLYLLNIYI